MSIQPTHPPRATAADLALAFVTVARVLDSHGIAPWSMHVNQGDLKCEVYVSRDEFTRLVPDVDGAALVVNGEFMHLNGTVEGVAVEFYADAEDADRIAASLASEDRFFRTHLRTVATS